MSSSRHALIVGAGIAGPALALFLKKAGIQSTICELRPEIGDIGGMLSIAPNGMHVLAALGLAEPATAVGTTIAEMVFRNYRGRVLSRAVFDPRRFGQPTIALKRADLHRLLFEAARREGISFAFGRKLVAIEDRDGAPVRARFADGSVAEGDFLIGADGLHSAVRDHVVPDGPTPHFMGLLGIGGFVPRAVLDGTGTDPHAMTMVWGPGSFFGYGYAAGDAAAGAGWWINPPRASELSRAELAAMTPDMLRPELLKLHRGWAPPVETLIAATTEIIALNIYDVGRLPNWHRGRVALIGDAAHAVSPNSGQGASLALEDSLYLARLIRDLDAIEPAFARFEAERRERVEKVIDYGRRAGNDKKVQGAVALWLRDRMIAWLLPFFMNRMGWMYEYRLSW